MTSHEKAVGAVNARLGRLQANLRAAEVEAAQRFLFQSIVVTIGVAEALNDYIKAVGTYAQRRHADVKETNAVLTSQHAEMLNSGKELLEQLKLNPTDKSLRKEIERVQQNMASIQKNLRRGANTLQRELAPSLALIDQFAVSVRQYAEAEQSDALKRVIKTVVDDASAFFAGQRTQPAEDAIVAAAWKKAALSEIDQSEDFYDAFARTGFQVTRALELLAVTLAETQPQSAEDANQRANDAVAIRLKDVTARITTA